jgi:hypothetical protein
MKKKVKYGWIKWRIEPSFMNSIFSIDKEWRYQEVILPFGKDALENFKNEPRYSPLNGVQCGGIQAVRIKTPPKDHLLRLIDGYEIALKNLETDIKRHRALAKTLKAKK